MKKVLSLILTIAMVMSLFSAVPVSADNSEVYAFAKLPYFFCDFENNRTVLPDATIETDDERGDVARLSTVNAGPNDVEIASSAYSGNRIGYDLEAGDYVTVSFWLKLSKPLVQGSGIRVLMWDRAEAVSEQKSVVAYIPDYTSTDWQYVSGMLALESDFTFEKINLRPGVNTNNMAADGTYEVDYLIDDLEIKIEKGTYNDKAITWAKPTSISGYDQYYASPLNKGTATVEGPSGRDVFVKQYQANESMLTSGGVCQMLKSGAGGQTVTVSTGNKIRVTMWIHNDKPFASQAYYIFSLGGKDFKFAIPMEAGWHRIDETIVVEENISSAPYHAFGATRYDLRTSVKATDGTFPVLSVFDYCIFIKSVESALMSVHTSYSHSGSGSVALWNNGMEITGSAGITATQHDGTEGTVSEIKAVPNATGDARYNQLYNANWAGCTFNHTAGDVIKVSAWVKFPEPSTSEKVYYTLYTKTNFFSIPLDGKSTDWQYIEGSFVTSGDYTGTYNQNYAIVSECIESTYWPQNENGENISIYVDDWKITVSTPSELATLFPVADVSSATITDSGLNVDYTITAKTGETIEIASAVFKIIGAESGLVYASAYSVASMPEVEADEELLLEVVPVANGFVGEAVEVELIDLTTDVEEPDVEEPNGDRPEAGGSGGGGEVLYSYAKLPYFFCDFENNRTVLPDGTTIETDDERGDVARLSTVDAGPNDVEIASSAYADCHVSYAATAGDHISVGMWIKLSKPLAAGSTIRILLWDDALAPTTQQSVYANIPDVTSTDWQYASGMAVLGSDYTFGKISFRVGNNSNNQAADDTYVVDYLIDDFELKIEKGAVNAHSTAWAGTSSVSGWDQYAADGIRIGTATIEGPSGADVAVAQYQGKEEYVTSGGACAMYKGGAGNQKATVRAGDEVRVTMWIHNDKAFASQAYHIFRVGAKTFAFPIPLEAGWHRIDQTIVNDTDVLEESVVYHLFGAKNYDRRSVVTAEDGSYPVLSVFDYRIYIKGVDKAYIKENEKHTHNGSGYVAYWGNGMAINGNVGITTMQHDKTEGLVSEVKANGEPDKFNQMYNTYGTSHKFKHAPGDVIKVSAWVKLPVPAAENKIYYTVHNLTESLVLPINGKSTNWQYIEGSMVASKDHSNIYYHGYTTVGTGSYAGINTSNWPKDADGNNISIYVDDWKITVSTPSASATLFPVANLTFAAMTPNGLNVDYTITSKKGETFYNTSEVFKIVGAETGRVYASAYSVASVPAVEADEELLLEVVPVANGFVGVPAKIALGDLSVFNGIEILDGDATFAQISTAAILENATLIWAGYDENNRMTGSASTTVNKDAYRTFKVSNTCTWQLGDWSYVKIFLWCNISESAIPAAEYYIY